jgi:hypothetical protein
VVLHTLGQQIGTKAEQQCIDGQLLTDVQAGHVDTAVAYAGDAYFRLTCSDGRLQERRGTFPRLSIEEQEKVKMG